MTSAVLVDIAIAVTLVEGAVLAAAGRRDLLLTVAAGLGLMGGLRSLVMGAGSVQVAAWLAAAGVAHAVDVVVRVRRARAVSA